MIDKNMLISVIVPVYNTEKYIMRCVKSIIFQKYVDIEIILVDDGSTDNSGKLCDELAALDKKICVIHKPNGGSTSARKAGTRAANGEYVMFVDSDDWIDENMIMGFLETLQKYEADIITSAAIWEDDQQNEISREENELPIGIYNKEALVRKFYPFMLYYSGDYKFGILQYLWGKLFRKKLICDVLERMDERIWNGEDVACLYDACLYANSVYIDNHFYYHYFQRLEGSISFRKYGDEHFTNIRLLYSYLREQFEQSAYNKILLPQLNKFIFTMMNKLTKEMLHYNIQPGEAWKLPMPQLTKNPNIILYGAGGVGKSYYDQIRRLNYLRILAWVDKRFIQYQELGINVQSPSVILQMDYDMILVAIDNKKIFTEIKRELESIGVKSSKICWEPTESVFNGYLLQTWD